MREKKEQKNDKDNRSNASRKVTKPATLKEKPATLKEKRDPKRIEKGIWNHPPGIAWERTRKQVMCRTGKSGPGSTHAITFAKNGGEKGDWKCAELWLKDMTKQFKAHVER